MSEGNEESSMAALSTESENTLAGGLRNKEKDDYDIMKYLVEDCAGCERPMTRFLWNRGFRTPHKLWRRFKLDKAQEWYQDDYPDEVVPWVDLQDVEALVDALHYYKYEKYT